MNESTNMNATAEINEVNAELGLTAAEQQFANAAPYEAPDIYGDELPASMQPPAEAEGATEIKSAGDFGRKLRAQTMAVRLKRKKWGITKKLEREQVRETAEQFHAEAGRLTAAKKLIDSKSKIFRNCISTINSAVAYWREMTVPYPELGIRLMRKDRLEQFTQRMNFFKAELTEYVGQLKDGYNELIEKSRVELGELFNLNDYPVSQAFDELFALEWDFPTIEANNILKQLNPQLYEQEQKRIQARFDEAVSLATDAFMEEFHSLVGNLAERLKMGEDGKPRMFKQGAIEGLSDFFAKFKDLNIGNNAELDALVSQASELVKGDTATITKTLRNDVTIREQTQKTFAEIAAKLDAAIVAKPSRRLFLEDEE